MLEASALELFTVAIYIINSVDKTNIILLYSPSLLTIRQYQVIGNLDLKSDSNITLSLTE